MILLGRPIGGGLPLISWDRRFEHILIVGGSRTGKTTVMINLLKHFDDGGVIVISPDGSLAEAAYRPGCQYITKQRPVSLNPLKVDYLSLSERADLFSETLNFTSSVATKGEQMVMLVLMQDILYNCVRIGMVDFKEIAEFLRFEHKRFSCDDEYWRLFDRRDKRGNLVEKESVDSARRVAARINRIVNDENAYRFFKGSHQFSVKRIADAKQYYVFNLFGMDEFVRSFIGSLIIFLVRDYYRHQAIKGGPPLYVLVDEGVHFIEDTFYKTFIEASKFNVSFTVSYHDLAQLHPQKQRIIVTSAHTHVLLERKGLGNIIIDKEECPCYMNPPPKTIHKPPPDIDFLRDEWIAV
jgi:hypothetical protein